MINSFIRFCVLCLLCVCPNNYAQAQHKTEVKYAIPDLMQLPAPILDALKTGKEHPDILRRGFVVQEYLAVTKKNIAKIFKALDAAGIPFGSQEELELFLFPGKTQEIRLMQKCLKEKGVIKELYQITMFGPGGISCARVETQELLDERQKQAIQVIFNEFRTEVSAIVRKVFFELVARDQENVPLLATKGMERSVEIDIFLSSVDGKLVATFIDGEIKFREALQQEAKALALTVRQNPRCRPSYFGIDITDEPRCKARNIALSGVPAGIQSTFEEFKNSNQFRINKIVSEFKTWGAKHITTLACEPPSGLVGSFLNKKVLLNAEAFGFGPTAAIAEFFPYLRDRVAHLSYIGTGHTLDLQSKLPYDNIYDYGAADPETRKANFLAIARDFDVFITASDYEAAGWAKSLGLTLIIYDPLTWYWHELPDIISQADFYVAQNFFGVSERLKLESARFPENAVVPAIISGLNSPEAKGNDSPLFVNLGGLSNPYLQDKDLISFAKVVLGTVHEVLEPEFQHTYYVSSKAIANGAKDVCQVASMLPHQVQRILNSSKLAIMTSGLGNIFEASTMQKLVIWLPPANDSQGQQIKLLQQHHMTDFAIDWHDILEDEEPINYFAPQPEVLQRIAACMQKLAVNAKAQTKLKLLLKNALLIVQSNQEMTPSLSKLAETFEVGGAKQAVESIVQFLAAERDFASLN